MSYPLIEPEEILEILNTIEKTNDQYKNLTFSTRQYFFADTLTPMNNGYASIGNKFAWQRFNYKNDKYGYYVSMDANNFRDINNNYTHVVGDEVIKLISYSLRKATIGLGELGFTKLFRTGGDEFVFFTESEKEVYIFITKAKEIIDEIEPFPIPKYKKDNLIKITLSFGIGQNYYQAEKALNYAKKQKSNYLQYSQIPHLIERYNKIMENI